MVQRIVDQRVADGNFQQAFDLVEQLEVLGVQIVPGIYPQPDAVGKPGCIPVALEGALALRGRC